MIVTHSSRIGRLGLLSLICSALAGCGLAGAGSGDEAVVVDGSSTVFRISRAAQEAFFRANDRVETVVDTHGTGGGFIRYLQGEVDIVGASRAAKKPEEEQAKALGLDWVRFLVGYDGITVVVNPANDFVRDLSVGQLKALWEPESKIVTWRDLDPNWPDRPIRLYGPDKNSGTFEFFTGAIVGKAKRQREDVQSSPDDNVLVRGVSGDPDALGYLGFAYYTANADKLRMVPIRKSEGAPPVAPSPETILARTYLPLARPLYLYAKKSSVHRPGVAAFLQFYLGNIRTLAPKAGYVPPTPEDEEANRKALAPFVRGDAAPVV